MHMLVESHGQPGWVTALTPFSVDGMILAASTTLGHHGGATTVHPENPLTHLARILGVTEVPEQYRAPRADGGSLMPGGSEEDGGAAPPQ
jgi:hypothetical protein